MNSLEALYFPGTAIYSARQFPVFLLLGTAHLLQPVETADNSADIFITSGLCQAYTPCPLGADRDRFLRLIRDIHERKDDYAAQLSALTIASLSAQKASVDDTTRGIVSSLLGGQGVTVQPEKKQDELLWQARLVLKIGEILDQEEEEVAVQMALLDDQEVSLYKELQGEMDEEEESLLAELRQIEQKLSRPAAATVRNRLNAWSRIYRAASEPERPLWLTHLPEAADIILEKYETAVKLPALKLGELELPANIGWSRNEAVAEILRFREQNATLLSEMAEAFTPISQENRAVLSQRWSQAVAGSFPEEQHGRTTLDIYQLASVDCATMLGKPSASGSLLAVIRQQE